MASGRHPMDIHFGAKVAKTVFQIKLFQVHYGNIYRKCIVISRLITQQRSTSLHTQVTSIDQTHRTSIHCQYLATFIRIIHCLTTGFVCRGEGVFWFPGGDPATHKKESLSIPE
jgi:hypothetical protein